MTAVSDAHAYANARRRAINVAGATRPRRRVTNTSMYSIDVSAIASAYRVRLRHR